MAASELIEESLEQNELNAEPQHSVALNKLIWLYLLNCNNRSLNFTSFFDNILC